MRKFLVPLGFALLAAPVFPAGPASAHPEHGVFIQWHGPTDGQRVSGEETHIRAKIAFGADGVKSWAVEVLAPPGAQHPGYGRICEETVGGAPDYVEIDCPWDTTVYPDDGGLAENHRYVVRVSAENAERAVFSNPSETHVSERSVVVSNGVTAPRGVTLSFSEAGRQATVRWSPNPEPDVARYVIQERVGGESWRTVGEAGKLTSFTRRITAPGTYRYQVAAVRPSGVEGETVQSAFSGPGHEPREIVVTEPKRPAAGSSATTTTTGPTEGPAATGDPSPTDPGVPAPVEAGGTAEPAGPGGDAPAWPSGTPGAPGAALITAIQPGAPGSVGTQQTFGGTVLGPPRATAPKPAPEPDGPFSETLPYPKQDAPEASGDSADGVARMLVAIPGAITDDGRRALVVPLAGGLLLFVLAMHFFYLSRRARPDDVQ